MYGSSIVSLPAVSKFEVSKSYLTFQVKTSAGGDLAEVNAQVKKVCGDIDAVIGNLNTLIKKMGKNDSMNTQIKNAIGALEKKKQEFIDKNDELFKACDKVLQYIFDNKADRTDEASIIQRSISNIPVYGRK